MKTALFSLLFVAFLAAAIFGVWYFIEGEKNSEFVLFKEEGTILYKDSEEDEYETLTEEEITLKSGAYVKTEVASYARVYLPDNSIISLAESTELQITVDTGKTDVKQLIGNTWNRVQELGDEEEYSVETPNTIAAVRGTIFSVSVTGIDDSSIVVEDNAVEVSRFEARDGDKKILEKIITGENEITRVKTIDGISSASKAGVSDDFRQSFWYRRNKAMDEAFHSIGSKNDDDAFRDAFREKLEKRSDFKELQLGGYLRDTKAPDTEDRTLSTEELQQELKAINRLTLIDSDTCSDHSLEDIDRAISVAERYHTQIINYDNVIELLRNVRVFCSDGVMTNDELKALKEIIGADVE